MQLVIDDQIAEGDKVATRWHGEMTHLGLPGSASATGGRLTIYGITTDHFEGGKIVEAWRSIDILGLRLAIGAPSTLSELEAEPDA